MDQFPDPTPLTPRQFGQRMSELMDGRQIKLDELARQLGLCESSIRKMRRGENTAQYIQLARISRALGTTPNHLLGFDAATPVQGETLDTNLVLAAFQGILEQVGLRRREAEIGARLALETAREQSVVGEDPETRIRILAKDRMLRSLNRE